MLGPIFAREWLTLPRRPRHYLARSLYLGLMWILALTAWQATVGWEQPATLGDTARFGLLLFQILIYVQLLLLLFFATLSAASAVTQEKDRRTFVLLLLTDMRNPEIVLGKLAGSLLQILVFLTGSVPLLFLVALLGGVAPFQVLHAALVLAMTALAAGSLGSLVALWRDKTFQALALAVLFLVLYFCVVHGLAFVPAEGVARWQTWLQPFLALQEVVEPPDDAAAFPAAYGFGLAMLAFSVALNGLAIWKLRVWNPSGEPIQQRERPEEEVIDRARAHAAPGKLRHVWANPVLWREIGTRAYGRRVFLVKLAYFVIAGLAIYYALTMPPGDWRAATILVPVGILSLLLISAQAVTAVTTERDIGSLDLLLVTDLTPNEFIFGKLLGVLYNIKEYILPSLIIAAIFAWRGMLASPPRLNPELLAAKNLEALVFVALGTLILMGFTMILGVHVALGTDKSRLAIGNTLGTVFFLSVGTLICIYLILINGRFEYQWLSFSGFIFAGVLGLWWVLSGQRPSPALTMAAWLCPFAVFYSVTNILIGKPALRESADPLLPFLVTGGSFSFAIAAMMIPLLSEFDVALGRTSGGGE
ncbi:MAG: ABC transporter permease [Planctomycetes bacterium]|nr:ABC transporter permease [Planctomycetota bacterium]